MSICPGFATRLGHIKDHHKMVQTSSCMVRNALAVQLDCLKGRIVCRTVYGDIHTERVVARRRVTDHWRKMYPYVACILQATTRGAHEKRRFHYI